MAPRTINDELAFCSECEEDLPLENFSHYDPEEENICNECLSDIEEEAEHEEDYELEEDEELEFEEG